MSRARVTKLILGTVIVASIVGVSTQSLAQSWYSVAPPIDPVTLKPNESAPHSQWTFSSPFASKQGCEENLRFYKANLDKRTIAAIKRAEAIEKPGSPRIRWSDAQWFAEAAARRCVQSAPSW